MLCHMLQARSGLCMYRVLFITVCMRSCNNGELCVVFVCGSRSSCNLFYFTCSVTLCTGFTMFGFASHIFLLNLVRYILTSRMQRTHTTLGRF